MKLRHGRAFIRSPVRSDQAARPRTPRHPGAGVAVASQQSEIGTNSDPRPLARHPGADGDEKGPARLLRETDDPLLRGRPRPRRHGEENRRGLPPRQRVPLERLHDQDRRPRHEWLPRHHPPLRGRRAAGKGRRLRQPHPDAGARAPGLRNVAGPGAGTALHLDRVHRTDSKTGEFVGRPGWLRPCRTSRSTGRPEHSWRNPLCCCGAGRGPRRVRACRCGPSPPGRSGRRLRCCGAGRRRRRLRR